MAQVTSADISNVISFAKSDPEVSRLLRDRDDDVRLVCVYITCKLLNRIEEPVKDYEVVFNYDFVRENLAPDRDVVVTVEVRNGRAEVVSVKETPAGSA